MLAPMRASLILVGFLSLTVAASSCLAAPGGAGVGWASDPALAASGAATIEAAPAQVSAAVPASDPVAAASESLAAGRAAEAYARLAPLEAARAGDPEFDYLLALAALQSGRAAAAVVPLRRVLALEPRFDAARLELARALQASGDARTARREYEWVAREGGSAVTRDAARRALAVLDGARPRPAWRFAPALVAGAGYDSNANASPAGDVFGFVFDPQAVRQSSPILEAGGSLAGERAFGVSGRAAVLLRAGHRAHPDASFVDQSVIDAGAGFRRQFGAWTAGVGATLARGWLDGATWFDSAWVEGALSRPVGRAWELVGAGRAVALDYREARFEPLDARRFVWGAALQSRERAGEIPRLGLGVLGGRDDARDRASPWSNDRYGVRLFGAWPLDARRALFAEAAWLTSDFFGARGFFGIDRLDRQFVTAAGLDVRGWPYPGWRITPSVRWTDNRSNVTPFRFDRFEASVFLRREFD
ncbi:MAG: hypothetical protein MUF07_05795 [Steroidobacteraceae bacterium]|jgi:Flp pilus assembly protein TadD|nr:hypothetical protein [Steroidobacteraceae bacterium]